MGCGSIKVRRFVPWSYPSFGALKFNMNGASRENSGPEDIGVCHYKGEVSLMFSKIMGVCNSNEVELLTILEALQLFSRCFTRRLIVESDSSNVIAWVSNRKAFPWKLQFLFNEINVAFHHENMRLDR